MSSAAVQNDIITEAELLSLTYSAGDAHSVVVWRCHTSLKAQHLCFIELTNAIIDISISVFHHTYHFIFSFTFQFFFEFRVVD